jgi:hypothetical protein
VPTNVGRSGEPLERPAWRRERATSYDEEVTPAIDPPRIEPPPTATVLGRIFAHRRRAGTVVQAPLVRVTEPAPPEPVDEPVPDGPVTAEPVADEPVAPEPAAARAPDPRPVAAAETPAAEPVATRFCTTCDARVPLAADGLHCRLGHRLSPAHARRRGLFRRGG